MPCTICASCKHMFEVTDSQTTQLRHSRPQAARPAGGSLRAASKCLTTRQAGAGTRRDDLVGSGGEAIDPPSSLPQAVVVRVVIFHLTSTGCMSGRRFTLIDHGSAAARQRRPPEALLPCEVYPFSP